MHSRRCAADSEALNAEVEELNSLMTASIHYWLPTGEEEVLDGNILRDWMLKDADGHYVKDEATIRAKAVEYVKGLAERVDTVEKREPSLPPAVFPLRSAEEITAGKLIRPRKWKSCLKML
jgi:hypothetical protein